MHLKVIESFVIFNATQMNRLPTLISFYGSLLDFNIHIEEYTAKDEGDRFLHSHL